MEEIRRAGQAHYDNMSSLEKEMVKQMFASHAANGEGRISRQDVFIQFANSMPTSNIASFFSMIDKDNNGFLDFSEFVTLHYVTHSRPPCNCCKKIVNGLYFCCERCWEMLVRSRVEFQPYELCSECYYGKRFIHEHHEFLDNFMLLRSEANRHSRKKEKVLEAGRFHFKFLTEPELNVARKLFGEMDQDGDCRVHSNEVIDFLISKGMPSTEAQKIFDNMGLMQNSYLTFEDLVAFWYVLVNRPVCDGCSDIIMGSYYTCDACFYAYNDGGDTNTYDLCHGCYSKNGKYDAHREHGIFVDNTALLLHLKDQKATVVNMVIGSLAWVEDDMAWIDEKVVHVSGEEIKIICTNECVDGLNLHFLYLEIKSTKLDFFDESALLVLQCIGFKELKDFGTKLRNTLGCSN